MFEIKMYGISRAIFLYAVDIVLMASDDLPLQRKINVLEDVIDVEFICTLIYVKSCRFSNRGKPAKYECETL